MIRRLLLNLWQKIVTFRHLLVGALILAIGMISHIIPLHDDLERHELHLHALQRDLERKHSRATQLPVYREQLAEMEQQYLVLNRQLPDKPELDQLLDKLVSNAMLAGNEFQQFIPRPVETRDFYQQQRTQIRLQGSYQQLSHFARLLADEPYITQWNRVQLKPTKTGESLVLEAELSSFNYLAQEKSKK